MKQTDPYVYPGTNVLINKFDCHDPDRLMEIEALSTGGNLAYLQLHPIKGSFDFKHLRKIHHFIFQDLYDWAGEVRTVDIGKNNLFCRAQFINDYAQTVFSDFYSSCLNTKDDRHAFLHALVSHYADVNALHPFREGNGRSQREFTRELCMKCGYMLDLTKTLHKDMLEASILSFNAGDNSALLAIFEDAVIPVKEYADIQKRLSSTLLILSKDDI